MKRSRQTDQLHPHLAQAYRKAALVSRMQDAMEAAGVNLLLVDQVGQVRWASPRARDWLAVYFPKEGAKAYQLPPPVLAWLEQQRARLKAEGDSSPPTAPLAALRAGGRLTVRLAPSALEDGEDLLLLEQEASGPDLEGLRALGLSRREAEVLYWVAQGKTDGEIAELLVVSPRTVHKHLEHVYDKLGVRGRLGALVRALKATDARQRPSDGDLHQVAA